MNFRQINPFTSYNIPSSYSYLNFVCYLKKIWTDADWKKVKWHAKQCNGNTLISHDAHGVCDLINNWSFHFSHLPLQHLNAAWLWRESGKITAIISIRGNRCGFRAEAGHLHDIIFIHCCLSSCWFWEEAGWTGGLSLWWKTCLCFSLPSFLSLTLALVGVCLIESDWHVSQKKHCAFTLRLTLNLYGENQKTTNTKKLYPAGKWIFWTSLKRLIAFIVSLCFAFIDC